MKYQWILFDADETLFHFDAFQGLKLMFSRLNVDFTQQDFDEYQELNKPLWLQYQEGSITAECLQITRFSEWANKLEISAQYLNSQFLTAMADICAPLLGVKELLQALKGKVKLGIITNGFTALQRIRLERTGLHDVFDLLVISEQVGVAKPNVKIFEHAFSLMGNPAKEQVLMVGDTLKSDIKGGINMGIDTCWYNAHSLENNEAFSATFEVTSHDQLQRLLRV